MSRVVVTGGSGKLGRACVSELVNHGYDVVNVDRVFPADLRSRFASGEPEELLEPFSPVRADLEDFGETLEALAQVDTRYNGVDALVHLAAIPAPGLVPNHVVFRINTMTTYNVFAAARRLGIRNVVWASSETVLGLPFDTPPPAIPVDEDMAPKPESAYALAKLMGEEMARQFCRWDPALKIIGLRFSNVMEPQDYRAFPRFDAEPETRKWNLWGYIDARDGATAIRLALEAPITGAEVFIIANAETVVTRPNRELVAKFFPGVPYREGADPNETLLSIAKARQMLGYEPKYGWRRELGESSETPSR
jgi:nucleoside-diphosphate-sugar epimerase